jgi:2-keto-4-pentenoate hydratase
MLSIEAELAVRVSNWGTASGGRGVQVDAIAACLDVASSRLQGWPTSAIELIGDCCGAGWFVLGTWHSPQVLRDHSFRLELSTSSGYSGTATVDESRLVACHQAVDAVARDLRSRGIEPKPGTVVSCGPLIPATGLDAGATMKVSYGSLGAVTLARGD